MAAASIARAAAVAADWLIATKTGSIRMLAKETCLTVSGWPVY